MNIYVAGLMHEANAFSPVPTPASAFTQAPHDASGFDPSDWFGYGDLIQAVEAAGDTARPGIYFMATPSAPCAAETFSAHCEALLVDLARQKSLDGVLLFLHGAQTAQGESDCAGSLTERVRDLVGPSRPIGVLLDLHANVTERLLNAANLVAACKEYPHTDFLQTAETLWRELRENGPYCRAWSWRPVPAFPASTTTHGPMHAFVAQLRENEADTGVILASALHGFPHADVRHASAGILVYADTLAQAEALASSLAVSFFDAVIASAKTAPGLTLEAAIRALHGPGPRPLLIAERSDNPGAGGAGDATHLLHALRANKIRGAALALLYDPEAVERAMEAGVGSYVRVALGGKANRLSGAPFEMNAAVRVIRTDAVQPVFEGSASQALGTSVLLEEDGLQVIVNSIRQQPFSPEVFTAHGIDIRRLDVVVVKSTNHFYGSFAPLVARVVYCDAPGAATEDLTALPYTLLSRPVWPLDDEEVCRAAMRAAPLKAMAPNG